MVTIDGTSLSANNVSSTVKKLSGSSIIAAVVFTDISIAHSDSHPFSTSSDKSHVWEGINSGEQKGRPTSGQTALPISHFRPVLNFRSSSHDFQIISKFITHSVHQSAQRLQRLRQLENRNYVWTGLCQLNADETRRCLCGCLRRTTNEYRMDGCNRSKVARWNKIRTQLKRQRNAVNKLQNNPTYWRHRINFFTK